MGYPHFMDIDALQTTPFVLHIFWSNNKITLLLIWLSEGAHEVFVAAEALKKGLSVSVLI
jgi:hypothetical protein